jgi:hypothetical protein
MRSQRRFQEWVYMLRNSITRRDVPHEAAVITISYVFIFAGAWNDGLLGFEPSAASRFAEYAMAVVLGAELTLRIRYTTGRGAGFWSLAALDVAAILTVFPMLDWIGFARIIRMCYAAVRLTRLLDRLAADRNNSMYAMTIVPFVVPLLAAAVYAFERGAPGAAIQNYGDALRMCFSFSLSLGNTRPSTDGAMAICGALFLIGLLTIGVLTNTISARYQDTPIEPTRRE